MDGVAITACTVTAAATTVAAGAATTGNASSAATMQMKLLMPKLKPNLKTKDVDCATQMHIYIAPTHEYIVK